MGAPTIEYVRAPGDRRVLARRWTGHGRPLVLLHGLLDSSEGWDDFARTSHRPCIAIDLPGFGGSDLPLRPRIASYAEDVVAALDALDVTDCTLVGHSLGGAVAAAVVERTDAVRSLVMLAPVGFGAIRLADAFALPVVNGAAAAALPFVLSRPLIVTAAYSMMVSRRRLPARDMVQRLRSEAAGAGAGARAAVLAISAAGHAADGFARRELGFDGPVAALWGEHDALVPRAHAHALLSAIPRAHVQIWPGMGHHPQRERPLSLARFVEQQACRARRAAARSRGVPRGPIRHPAQRIAAARLRAA